MGQLVSFVCLTLAKDRFCFLSLKSQDRSRWPKLFLAEPLAQTPGTYEMGGGAKRRSKHRNHRKTAPSPLGTPSCGTLPLGWRSQYILFSPFVDSRAPWGCDDQRCFRWMMTECSQNYAVFPQIFKPFKCWDSLNSLSIPHLTAKKELTYWYFTSKCPSVSFKKWSSSFF